MQMPFFFSVKATKIMPKNFEASPGSVPTVRDRETCACACAYACAASLSLGQVPALPLAHAHRELSFSHMKPALRSPSPRFSPHILNARTPTDPSDVSKAE